MDQMDEFKDIDLELMKLKEELGTKDELLKQVKFPASGDYWRSRLDEERQIWDKKASLGTEERKILEKKLNEQEEMLSRYNRSVSEMEKKIENDAKLWEERLRLKEADILIEKNRLQAETRIREIEFERQKLTERVTELSSKINELHEQRTAEAESLKTSSKHEAEIYEEKIRIASTEAQSLKDRLAEIEVTLKGRITELEGLKEEYRLRLEHSEKKVQEELQARFAAERDVIQLNERLEEEKTRIKGFFESTISKFEEVISRDIGVISGFARLITGNPVDKRTLAVLEGLTDKVQAEIGGFEKELNMKFSLDDNFKAAFIMADEDAAYWEAALSGSNVKIWKIGPQSSVNREVFAQKPCVCVVSERLLRAARRIRSKWPFMPVIIYGPFDGQRSAKLAKAGFVTVSTYATADDMMLSLSGAAKTSVAHPEYWDKIKFKNKFASSLMAAAGALMFVAGIFYANNPAMLEKFDRVASYSVPYSQPSNITFDGEYLWGCDWFGQSIYKHDTKNGLKLLRIFCFPGKHFTAITWAGGYLWSADAWENKIYKHNADDSFTVVATYPAPGTAVSGLAFDGKNIWSCDSATGMIYRHSLDEALTVEASYKSPGASPSGLFYDGKSLWSVDSKSNKIFRHRMDGTLSVETAFIPPLYDQKNYNLSGIAVKNGRFWVCSEKQGKVFSFSETKMEKVAL